MGRVESLFGLALMAVGGAMAIVALRFPAAGDALGAAFLPCLVAAALIVLGAATAVRARRSGGHGAALSSVAPTAWRRLSLAVGALAAFYVVLASSEGLGFPVLGPMLVMALAIAFGGRVSPATVVTAIAVAEGAYVVFRYWFGLPLPPSMWF